MENKTISNHDIKSIRRSYEIALYSKMDILLPMLNKAYKNFLKENHVYDVKNDYMHNISRNLKSFGDADYYAGMVDPNAFKHNKRALYIHTEGYQYLIQFIDSPFTDEWQNKHEKGITIHQVFNDVNLDCIEKSWGFNSTEKFVTGADLIVSCFTDVTKHSQVLSKGKISCSRPTVAWILDDFNKKNNGLYGPVFCTSTKNYSSNFGQIEHAFFYMIAMCSDLKINGSKL